ncbi:universal stress protein, partial [Pseudomonas syringae]
SNVAEQAEASVQRLGCDAVVMGPRGLGNCGGLLLGSVATRLIHEASGPVTLIK